MQPKPAKVDDVGGSPVAAEETVALGLGWSAALEAKPLGATLRLRHPEQSPLTLEIAITASGPVIRASAAALEIDAATDIIARCERFAVEARESVILRGGEIIQEAAGTLRASGGALELNADTGDVRVHANDDVKLLGERVLLNCDREEPLPSWLPRAAEPEATLRREDVSGNASLFDDLDPPK